MQGKRNQGVLHKYLLEAAEEVSIKGVVLAERLYVPEPFSETTRVSEAQRRREKLAVLRSRAGLSPAAIVMGECVILARKVANFFVIDQGFLLVG